MQVIKLGINKIKTLINNVFVSLKDVKSQKDLDAADLGSKKMSSAFGFMILSLMLCFLFRITKLIPLFLKF
jgi:hypothetical protein